MPDSLSDLARDLDRFVADRDWHKYHAPKNVASALIVEAGELLEHFQWMTEEQSRVLSPEKLAEVRGEMADVLLYLVQLGNVLGIDVVAAGREKLAINGRRFPVGNANRWESPFWKVYDFMLLTLALLHGVNGARLSIEDYVQSRGWRTTLLTTVWLIALVFMVIGAMAIVTFDVDAFREAHASVGS